MATAISLLCSHLFFVHHYSTEFNNWHFAYQIQTQWQLNCVWPWTVNITRLIATYHKFKFTKIFAITFLIFLFFLLSLNNIIPYSLMKLRWLRESTLPAGHKTRWLCGSVDRLAKCSHELSWLSQSEQREEISSLSLVAPFHCILLPISCTQFLFNSLLRCFR